MPVTYRIKTWSCPETNCTYHQDFNPNDSIKMQLHFPNVPIGKCPACWQSKSHATDPATRARIDSDMMLETNTNKQIKINIMSNAEIDNLSTDDITKIGKTKSKLKTQAALDITKYNSRSVK